MGSGKWNLGQVGRGEKYEQSILHKNFKNLKLFSSSAFSKIAAESYVFLNIILYNFSYTYNLFHAHIANIRFRLKIDQ